MANEPEPHTGGGRYQRRHPARQHQITDRDVEILKWITRHGVVTPDLVAKQFFWRAEEKRAGTRAAYQRLAALWRLDLVLRDHPFARHPDVIRVTRQGAKLADVGLKPANLVLAELKHTLGVVLLVEGLARQMGAEYETERELRAQRYRLQNEGVDISQGRCPDAILRIPAKGPGAQGIKRVALELDLSRKERRAMEKMIHQYDQEPDVDAVWWYVPPARVEHAKSVVADLNATDRFWVLEWRAPT